MRAVAAPASDRPQIVAVVPHLHLFELGELADNTAPLPSTKLELMQDEFEAREEAYYASLRQAKSDLSMTPDEQEEFTRQLLLQVCV